MSGGKFDDCRTGFSRCLGFANVVRPLVVIPCGFSHCRPCDLSPSHPTSVPGEQQHLVAEPESILGGVASGSCRCITMYSNLSRLGNPSCGDPYDADFEHCFCCLALAGVLFCDADR